MEKQGIKEIPICYFICPLLYPFPPDIGQSKREGEGRGNACSVDGWMDGYRDGGRPPTLLLLLLLFCLPGLPHLPTALGRKR